jgi:hypothetical protein
MSEFLSPGSNPSGQPSASDLDTASLLQLLRRKEGTWVDWGHACQTLQKAGYNPQQIFEETGFEPIHQNQIMVAIQVYTNLVNAEIPDAVRQHFQQKGSDSLYELRILTQTERVAAAMLLVEKQLDSEEAREVAKAVKEFSRLPQPPEGFTDHPGDAIAYQVWRLARQKSDLQERSRLIARGLKFAHSPTARQKVEALLTDFTVTPAKTAPILPVYRLETDEELPRVIPVVGKLPCTKADLQAVPFIDPVPPFGLVQVSGTAAWMAVPGWKVVLAAEDPVALLCTSDQLPTPIPGKTEEVMLIVDRAQRQWNALHYFLIEQNDRLQIQWLEQPGETPILGQLLLVMRPKKILDENYTKEVWQIDE